MPIIVKVEVLEENPSTAEDDDGRNPIVHLVTNENGIKARPKIKPFLSSEVVEISML